MKRIGLYGGSFNPPHAGHQQTILHALTTAQLDELLVAPVWKHPYGKELVPFGDRIVMCQYLLDPFNTERYKVRTSFIEERAYKKTGTGFTSDTVHLLIDEVYKQTWERPHVVLIMGSDLREDVKTWAGYDQLQELCMRGWCSFFFVDRIPGLSSTAVRNGLKTGAFVDRWLPKNLHEYLRLNNHYK